MRSRNGQLARYGPARVAAAAVLGLLGVTACTLPPGGGRAPASVYQDEHFQADETFSRLFDASVADTCEAARRALTILMFGLVKSMDEGTDTVEGVIPPPDS